MKKRLLGLLMFCVFGLLKVEAQEFSPFMSSPFAGVTAGKLNPASLAGSKYKFDVTLFGASAGVHNDLMILSRKELIFNTSFYKDMWSYRSDFFDLQIPTNARNDIKHYLRQNAADWDKDEYGGYFGGNIDIVNLMYSFNDRFALAAGYGKRWMAAVNNVPMPVAAEFFSGYLPGAGAYNNVAWDKTTTASVAMYDQVFLSAGYTLFQGDNHHFKLGLTGKLIFNGTSAFAHAENYRATFTGGTRGISGIGVAQYGTAGKALDSKLGFGGDAGIEYEYRPDALAGNEISEYRLKIGASILDLGGFKTDGARYRNLVAGTGTPSGIEDLLNMYGSGNKGEYTMGLPTVFTASVDYRFGESPIFLNFTPYVALNQKTANKAYKFTSYNLVPHAEWKKFGVSVPLQYDQYGRFTAGLGLRAWRNVWVGSNTILKNLWPGDNHNYSADAHVMVKFNILAQSNDRDGDGIPDNKDRCPDVPGLKKFQGCPDTDGDGIPDDQDACPYEAGPASTNGCPDRDGDGIADKDDRCPDQAGPANLQGCPDTDGDGIPDIDDACPTEPGPASTKGCPDRDGDGVPDKDDRCPDQAGPASLQGCPDRDNDGVPDIDDECPDVPGPASNKGCPLASKIQNVEFDIDKYNVKPQYHAELDKVVEILSKSATSEVTIIGHTDNTYTRAYNMQLSKRRAEAVKNYLVSKNIDAKRISTEYYGFDKPIADNNTVDGRSRNRRSEINVVVK